MIESALSSFLESHPVFSRDQLLGSISSRLGPVEADSSIRSWLGYQIKVGRLVSVRRGIYASAETINRDRECLHYLIAGLSAADAVIGFGAAFHWHMRWEAPSKIQVYSKLLQARATLRGKESEFPLLPVRSKHCPAQDAGLGFGVSAVEILGVTIRMTTLERTIVDVLHRPNLIEDFDRIWHALGECLATADLEEIRKQVWRTRCKGTTAKVGYLLTGHQDQIPQIEAVIDGLPKRPLSPHPWESGHQGNLDARWQIRVPQRLTHSNETPEQRQGEGTREGPRLKISNGRDLLDPASDALLDHMPIAFRRRGIKEFLPNQPEIIRAVLEGRDALAILPTGAGKSLLYQFPSTLLNGTTLVVSPTVALMDDQVKEARSLQLRGQVFPRQGECVARLAKGVWSKPHLLFMAPEAIDGYIASRPRNRGRIRQLVIDEAHLIHTWGSEFRIDYKRLGRLRDHFPGVPVLALTATATAGVRNVIIKQLRLQAGFVECRVPIHRPNLFLRTMLVGGKFDKKFETLTEFLSSRSGQPGVVYCPTRREAEKVSESLRKVGVQSVSHYHAGDSRRFRESVQKRFKHGEVDIVVATMAFGLGVNKENVRFVVHFGLPASVDQYAQEIGRAGRDRRWGECLLIHSKADIARSLGRLDRELLRVHEAAYSQGGDELGARQRFLQEKRSQILSMVRLANSQSCLHQQLAEHFGDPPITDCESCDRDFPLEKHRTRLGEELAQRIREGLDGTEKEWEEPVPDWEALGDKIES